MTEKKPKCRVNWNKPCRAGTVCNYVDEFTNECKQNDWKRCPCGGIVRFPRFEELPWKESDRVAAIREDERAQETPCTENGCTDIGNCDEICQHSRIYSPAQMQQAIAQATEAENKRVLYELMVIATGYESYKHISGGTITPNNPVVGVSTLKRDIASLRLPRPKPNNVLAKTHATSTMNGRYVVADSELK